MGNRMSLLVLFLTVLLYVEQGLSINCYECGGFPTNRTTNPLCEGEDDFGRDTGHSCHTDKGYSVCLKIEDPAGQKSMRHVSGMFSLLKWVMMLLSWARMNARTLIMTFTRTTQQFLRFSAHATQMIATLV